MEKAKILIVDDRIENIISLETILAPLDISITRALSGHDALEKTLENEFAIILIDVQMPEMDGFETVKIMRKVKKTRYTPVIYVSAIYSEDYYKIKGAKSGAVDFITKPIIPEIILSKVQIFLELYQQKRDLQKEIELRKSIELELELNQEHVKLINRILRHDITNNLSVIKSAINLYLRTNEREMLDNIESMVYKSVSLIGRMRELELFISQNSNLNPMELSTIIKTVADNHSDIEITVHGSASVFADDSIVSVFDNLINNAVQHGKSPNMEITIIKGNKYAEVQLVDFGVGISEAKTEKIFEEDFTYGDSDHTSLGLYIVKKAMDRFGGHIMVKHNTPNGVIIILEFLYVR